MQSSLAQNTSSVKSSMMETAFYHLVFSLPKVLFEEMLVSAPLAPFFLSKLLRKKRVGMSVLTDLEVRVMNPTSPLKYHLQQTCFFVCVEFR